MANKLTCDELGRKVKDVAKKAREWKHTEKALQESTRRLGIAYDQSIIYAEQLNEQIAERRQAEEALQTAYDELEERVKQRTDELLRANHLLKREIADRRRADEALRESEVRLKTVLDTIQAGIVVIDPKNHVIVGVNAAAGKMVGAPRERILGKVCHKYICPAEEGKCPATDLGENLDNAELVLLTASGRNVPILKTVVPVVLAGREHLLESFLDVTEHKRAQKELRESEKRMYENQKRMEILQFANDVALKMMHELRNPLAAIGGFAKRISSRDYPDDKLKEYAGIILEQSIRLDKAIEEVLANLKVAADSKWGSDNTK
jgi:PAS domain S-box-containing protein